RQVPQANGVVAPGGRQHLAVGGKCQRQDQGLVFVEAADFLAGGEIPQRDRAVAVGRGQRFAVRRKREFQDLSAFAAQVADVLAGGAVPHANCIYLRSRGNDLVVIGEGQHLAVE